MRISILIVSLVGALALSGCDSYNVPHEAEAAPPAPPPGAIPGTVAADRNGDGIIDGYYTADGVYHAYAMPAPPPPPPPPPPAPTRRGERG
jgi:hypothetical protein